MAIFPDQIAVVKSTAPIVREHGKAITSVFYKTLIAEHPELKDIFSLRNQQTGLQQAALADAVFAYASHIDDLCLLSAAVERIAHKHASLFVKPEQYPIVGKHLIGAMGTILGDGLTPQIQEAWIAAYGQLADVFIGREAQLYSEAGPEWQTWRKFCITRKEPESEGIVSFYLQPVDGVALRAYRPGQYVSLQMPIDTLDGLLQSRQFSISSPKIMPDGLRITVKREEAPEAVNGDANPDTAAVAGLISTRLHDRYQVGDEVELSPPMGEFSLTEEIAQAESPVVLLSAGVGATAVLPILDTLASDRRASYIHTARSRKRLCFRDHVEAAAKSRPNLNVAIFVKEGADGDRLLTSGRLSLEQPEILSALFLDDAKTQYYVCGPEEWMIQVRASLLKQGVGLDRIHLELFRTGDL